MRGNQAGSRLVRKECSAPEPFYEKIHFDGFDEMTVCRLGGNGLEVGHVRSCPVCQRKQY